MKLTILSLALVLNVINLASKASSKPTYVRICKKTHLYRYSHGESTVKTLNFGDKVYTNRLVGTRYRSRHAQDFGYVNLVDICR